MTGVICGTGNVLSFVEPNLITRFWSSSGYHIIPHAHRIFGLNYILK